MKRQIPENSTPIINEIIEKLACVKMSNYEFNIIFAIIRKTYGWDKKEETIKTKQLADVTGIHKQHISRTLKRLVQRKIVTQIGYKIGINKSTSQWLELPKQVTNKKVTQIGYTSNLNRLLELPKQVTNNRSAKDTNKRYLIKDTYGSFENVKLTTSEYEKLQKKFPDSYKEKIEELSEGIASHGYKYSSHYATILSWNRKHEKENIKNKQTGVYSNLQTI